MSTVDGLSTWRIVLAAILDFLFAFLVLGFLIATIFGGRTDEGFSLEGGPALLLFAAVAAYFFLLTAFSAARSGNMSCARRGRGRSIEC